MTHRVGLHLVYYTFSQLERQERLDYDQYLLTPQLMIISHGGGGRWRGEATYMYHHMYIYIIYI